MSSSTTLCCRDWRKPCSSCLPSYFRYSCSICSSPWWQTRISRSFAGPRKNGRDRCVCAHAGAHDLRLFDTGWELIQRLDQRWSKWLQDLTIRSTAGSTVGITFAWFDSWSNGWIIRLTVGLIAVRLPTAGSLQLLWSPYVIGQTIIFLHCDFYLLSSSSSSSSFFPRLISAVGNWMSTILLHMAWP